MDLFRRCVPLDRARSKYDPTRTKYNRGIMHLFRSHTEHPYVVVHKCKCNPSLSLIPCGGVSQGAKPCHMSLWIRRFRYIRGSKIGVVGSGWKLDYHRGRDHTIQEGSLHT